MKLGIPNANGARNRSKSRGHDRSRSPNNQGFNMYPNYSPMKGNQNNILSLNQNKGGVRFTPSKSPSKANRMNPFGAEPLYSNNRSNYTWN